MLVTVIGKGIALRVWDVHPGYLSRTRLLGEHREIHAVWTVLVDDRKGYSNHPETNRWRGHLSYLYQRHEKTVAEMRLRGYTHASPLENPGGRGGYPGFVHAPHEQFALLRDRYNPDEAGRIPLPHRACEFWAHHKYSIMARGYKGYRQISRMSGHLGARSIAQAGEMLGEVCRILWIAPSDGSLMNAWQHVTGHFKRTVPVETRKRWLDLLPDGGEHLGRTIYRIAVERSEKYIQHSTILSDGFQIMTPRNPRDG